MNHTEMVKLLLDHGADPSDRDVMDRTALDWAWANGNSEMAHLLQTKMRTTPRK
jgi:ankyrin repeat protein